MNKAAAIACIVVLATLAVKIPGYWDEVPLMTLSAIIYCAFWRRERHAKDRERAKYWTSP